jgi:hypothetical protein
MAVDMGAAISSPKLGEGREGEASEDSHQWKRGFPLPNPPPSRGRGLLPCDCTASYEAA